MRLPLSCFAALFMAALSAADLRAAEVAVHAKPTFSGQEKVRNYFNLRAGAVAAQSASGKRPNVCLEAAPIARLALEACGTGNGFLHQDDAPEMAHFRGHWRLAAWQWEKAWLHPRLGAGFTEIQVGADKPGFHFGDAAGGVETAGPEALASLQLVYGMPAGFEMVAELHAGAAYLAHAAELSAPMRTTQPFGGLTIGVGW